ncbi:hypothetical protein GpartN1_g3222.t1 [Galdieria partita]|uniref:Peptidase A1 domain-containing protein n=1 Tax=Galdieria partita TaxID=83374 RepID=A0A9C7PX54_9RHOD|nr:hypothetical protein GpartN1_g3222.t1 [Galdieria partita]
MAFVQYIMLTFLLLLITICTVATEQEINEQNTVAAQRQNSQVSKIRKLSLQGILQPAHIAFDLSSRPWNSKGTGNKRTYSPVELLSVEERHFNDEYLVPLTQSRGISKRRRQAAKTSATLEGGLITVGGYYTNISVGGKDVYVLIDTGSSTLAVIASGIEGKTNGVPFFNSSSSTMISCASSQCQSNTCSSSLCQTNSCSSSQACCLNIGDKSGCFFNLQYGDGSGANGILFEGNVSLSDMAAKCSIGAIVNDTKGFQVGKALGILGLAFSRLACNPTCITPFFDELVSQENIANVFSISLSLSSGTLVLGGIDDSLYTGPMNYVPMENRSSNTYYIVASNGLSVDGTVLNQTVGMMAAVDSGTTTLVFDEATYELLRSYFQSHYCSVPGLCPSAGSNTTWFSSNFCVVLDDQQLSSLPNISLQLENNVVLSLNATDYMVQVQQSLSTGPFALASNSSSQVTTLTGEGKSVRCLAINKLQGLKQISGLDMILGDTVLRKYYTVFDRQNSRIGFALSANDQND